MNDLINYVLKNWIAIISLAFSYVTWSKNRKIITVDFDEQIQLTDKNSVACVNNEGQAESYEFCLVTSVSIVNPSNQDIGFFDLRAFNPKTNINLEMVTSNTFPPNIKDKTLYQLLNKDRLVKLDYPERKFGVFKANSFTRLDIVLVVNEKDDFDKITINFKIPRKVHFSIFRDPFALTSRKIYSHKGMNYLIPDGLKKRIDLLKEQSIESEKQTNNTQQQGKQR